MLLLIVPILFVLIIFYLRILKINKYWYERGVQYIKPLPVFGNMLPTISGKKSLNKLVYDIYNAYPNERYVGAFQFSTPVLVIRDLDLLKTLVVKNFDTFPNHRGFIVNSGDYLANNNLFNLKVETGWHEMRTTLSPAFTSSKIRAMFVLMEECANQFINYFEEKEGEVIPVGLKDTFTRFANDVIGTAAFGVTCNSLKDRDNEFYTLGEQLSSLKGIQYLKILGNMFVPKLMTLMKVKFFNQEAATYFTQIIKTSLKLRTEQKIVRPDMIHLMMEAKNGRLKHESQSNVPDKEFAITHESDLKNSNKPQRTFTDDDIVAQAVLFFIAGFESVATTMSYTCYELAQNPEIQQRLYNDIKDACKKKLVYEVVQGLKYLDCIITEILRKWATGAFLDRVAVKPITIEPERPHEKPLHLNTGQVIWIPQAGIHRDPKYYPNPEKFDPERFNDENKENMHSCSYVAFGCGPRHCIGTRFAMLEIKIIIVKLLQNYEIVPIKETPSSVVFSPSNFSPLPDADIKVGFKRRNA